MTQQKTTVSTEEVREIAVAYALECKAKGQTPSLAEMSQRLGKNSQWLASRQAQSISAQLARAEVIKAWIAVGVAPKAMPSQPDLADSTTPMPETLITGDDLYGILNHPGRLAMFCDLTASGGIGAALRYAAQQHERIYAQPTAQRPD